MIKAAFIDQDNTILKTKESAKTTYKEVFEIISNDMKLPFEAIYQGWQNELALIKNSTNPKFRTFDYSLSKLFEKLKFSTSNLSEYLDKYYFLLNKNIEIMNLASETLEKIQIIKILETEDSKRQSNMKLTKFSLGKYFDMIITSDDTGIMKPDISYFKIAWDKFELKPQECVYIGDNWEKDCEIGYQLGGITIHIGENKNADYRIKEFSEVAEIIQQMV